MKQRTATILYPIVLFLGGLSALGQDPAPAGMLLLVKGQVKLNRGGSNHTARLGEILFAGDRLSVPDGEAIFVYCPLGKRLRLVAGSEALLLADRVETPAGPAVEVVDDRQCAIPKVALGSESLERIGGMRPRGKPPVTVYVGGRISTGRPHFEWSPVEGARRYRISVSDELGRVLWTTETAEAGVEFPAERAELPDGWFSWEVVALSDSEIVAQQTTPLEVRRSGAGPIRAAPAPDELLLRAVELENRGYFAEAASCVRRLGSKYPSDDRLRRRLAWLYWKAGLLPAFSDEMQALETEPGEP